MDRLRRIVPEDALDRVLAGLCAPRHVAFRVNTLRAAREAVFAELGEAGLAPTPVPWFPDAAVLPPDALRALQETAPAARGELFVQGLASMTAPLALAPRADERVLDLCAAPGGKTTLLACLMAADAERREAPRAPDAAHDERGADDATTPRLHANDGSRARVYKLRAVLEQQGVPDIETTARRGEGFGRTHAGAFDAVLLDAPCSAEARLHPASDERWTSRRIPRLAGVQTRLLEAAVAATRPGGRIVYATCTFAPEENEAVVDRVLARHGATLSVEPLDLPLPDALPGLAGWGRRTWHEDLVHARRLLPAPGVEGFFLVRLRKSAPPRD